MTHQTPPSAPLAPDEARRRLEEVKAKRGYLLAHHGLLAITAPDLLAGYDATYTAMTLTPRLLPRRVKEFVWLALLTASEEAVATHHVKLFLDAGGTEAEIEIAIRLGGFGRTAPCYAFAEQFWRRQVPGLERRALYRRALAAAVAGSGVPETWVELAMVAVSAMNAREWELAEHIRQAYALGVPEMEIAEALHVTLLPGGAPGYVQACEVWRDLVAKGEVPASESFRAWATAPDGRGFDGDALDQAGSLQRST